MKRGYQITRIISYKDKFDRPETYTQNEYLCTSNVEQDIRILGWNVISIKESV